MFQIWHLKLDSVVLCCISEVSISELSGRQFMAVLLVYRALCGVFSTEVTKAHALAAFDSGDEGK